MLSSKLILAIQAALQANGYTQNGNITPTHKRAWSTVLTVPTTQGTLYCKQTVPALRFEVALTTLLHQQKMPVPQVVASDAEQGWLLLANAGQSLRSLLLVEGKAERWQTVVSQFAQMQLALSNQTEALLATGLFDRRLTTLPDRFAKLLADKPAMRLGQTGGLSAAAYRQLQESLPRYAKLCQQLASFGLPETLHHDDFHDNNIFVGNGATHRYIFADWGEACLAHPFFSLIIVLRIAAYILKLDENDPALAAIRDAYLTEWLAFGTLAELQATFALAQTVGSVNRALTWHVLLGMMDETERASEADAVPGWLQTYLTALTTLW